MRCVWPPCPADDYVPGALAFLSSKAKVQGAKFKGMFFENVSVVGGALPRRRYEKFGSAKTTMNSEKSRLLKATKE
jgi:hypothetical protein